MLIGLIAGYVFMAVAVVIIVSTTYEDTYADQRRIRARTILLAPVWPLMFLTWMARKVWDLLFDAGWR